MPRVKKSSDKKITEKQRTDVEGTAEDNATGTKHDNEKSKKAKNHTSEKEISKKNMTLCTQTTMETARPPRRPGRPPSGKKIITPGKLRSAAAFKRTMDPCENSNDSGLGFDNHADPHHHTMAMSERLHWNGERAEPKRLRMDIKVENEEVNDNYCFPSSVLQCKDNISLIRTAPTVSVSSLSISNSTSTSSSRAVPRCTPVIGRQAPSAPTSLTTQHTASSRCGDISLTIVKQPEQQHRARYQTEGSRGAVKDRDGGGFPIVQLNGYFKPAILQVYIGTDIGKVTPHMFYQACKVSGKNSTPCVEKKIDGTAIIELSLDPAKDMCATCDCVGILKERNVDVEHRFPDQINNRSKKKSTRCRMIFRTTITHDNGSTETLQVCSQPIVCTQPPGIPEICRKSLNSCPASGGLDLFILGKNFLKDTKVFFQQYEDGQVCWEQGVAPDKEYLQQNHLVCVVPPYRRTNITEPVRVRLCVVSSGKTSESHQFVYTPVNGTVSAHADLHSLHATFKGALSSTFRKHQQDVDMMPPPESSQVPLATRRSSISYPNCSDNNSPPLSSLKQEYMDENSQSSMDSMEMQHTRYRPVSESSLDVNHDSNISMINDNSMDMMHDSLMSHMSDNSNLSIGDERMEMACRNTMGICENAVMNDDNSNTVHSPIEAERIAISHSQLHPSAMSPVEKVMDLRMKLPLNANGTDYVTTASTMATLRKFGIEHGSAPLPPQSAQSVENYLTKIESKSLLSMNANSLQCPTSVVRNSEKEFMPMQTMSNNILITSHQNLTSSFCNSQQPFMADSNAINNLAKSEAAAIAEQVVTGAITASIANTTLTSALEGTITTPMNSEKLDDILNSTLESHIRRRTKTTRVSSPSTIVNQDVILSNEASLLCAPVLNTTLSSNILVSGEVHAPPTMTPDAMLNTQLSPSLMCQNSPSVQQEPLIGNSALTSICATTVTEANLLPATMNPQTSLMPVVTTQESAEILSSEPEKAVLLEAAVDFLKTQKQISELTPPGTDTSAMHMETTMSSNFMSYGPMSVRSSTSPILMTKSSVSEQKRDYIPIPVKDMAATSAQNDKKIEDRMIPQSFTSLTENELINLINPTCFDQGNNYNH